MDRADSAASATDSAMHLTIDTSIVSPRKGHVQNSIPRVVASPSGDEGRAHEAVEDENMLSIKYSSNGHLDRNPRLRAMSDSERALYSSHTGMRIPGRHQGHVYSQLTPPLSESSDSFDAHNPYSTSAHLYSTGSPPREQLPDSPQSSAGTFVHGRRNSRGLQLSLQHREEDRVTQAKIIPDNLHRASSFYQSPSEVGRSASYAFGTSNIPNHHHHRTHTFVDASSYEDVPDSPAKLVHPIQVIS
jgi:hypothetical protein